MEVRLQQYLDILNDLEDLLAPSFGPCGRQVLITTGTGLCIVSKDGKMILESCAISHPIAIWIVNHVKGHYKATGDSSKSFILLFTELLRRVKARHHRMHCQSSPKYNSPKKFCLEMAQSFALLASEVLPPVLSSSVMTSPVLYSVPVTNGPRLEEFAQTVMFSTLQGNLPQEIAKHLAKLAMDFIQLSLPMTELKDRIHVTTDKFTYLCQEVSGHSVTDSHIIDGVLIPRNFAFYNDTLKQYDTDLRAVLIACDFVTEHLRSNTIITLSSVEQISRVAMSNEQKWSRLVTRLQSHNVTLLVTVNIVPEPLLAMCRRTNICVIHSVCLEDMSQISQRTGVSMMFDLEEDLDSLINATRFMERTILGKDVFSCVGFQSRVGQPLKHLVICGPTATLCRSYSASIQNALKVLYHCLDTSGRLIPQLGGAGQEGNGGPQPVQEWVEDIKGAKPLQASQEDSVSLYAVYGGGAVEQIMSNALVRFSSHSTNEQSQFAAAVFAEALEVIPRTLHNNSYRVDSKEYLRGKARTIQEPNLYMGIDARSGEWVTAAELGTIDSLESKLSLWQSVLQTICDLLRIDSVAGVKRMGCKD